jgi:O-acetyl-ADP-ribose deacetylase (regulator of RNase III)|tara:strand:- start:3510 stop:3995 length:486 start_codon:yes stop_codon:yes gene_type:complete
MRHIKGDLLKRPAGTNIIIHQANINGCMGSGIAAQIAKQIPEAAAVDTRTYNRLGVKLGSFSFVHLDDYTVVNLYGQSIKELSSAGIPTDYNAVVKSFQEIAQWLLDGEKALIAMGLAPVIGVPKFMGCGLGGGDWDIYSAIIEATIGQHFPVVCVEWQSV